MTSLHLQQQKGTRVWQVSRQEFKWNLLWHDARHERDCAHIYRTDYLILFHFANVLDRKGFVKTVITVPFHARIKFWLNTSMLKVWKIELTTIISEGSRTMHSHPRRRLPADRFPKLQSRKTFYKSVYLKPARDSTHVGFNLNNLKIPGNFFVSL